ncbi:Aspartate racemase [Usitatibacter rugosus]|uniref:Aspartate racemase n=1 Tax=Usitatibacter rugosus TaxID=2732067 RepID=A0A6M4GW92_9PROT|nr:amino acid racemase [Usitatibacter rugosus]QJR11571.1 Aspartate racemase [Usitatibacter rugosus]
MDTTLAAHPRRIGILGGMGPAATVDLLQKIIDATPAARDQDHVPTVVWNVPQIPERLAAMRGEGPSPLPGMIEGARALESVGCEALAVACNTAHHWADELRAAVRIPLLHIAEVAVEALAHRTPRPDTVGLLATRGTLQSGFYQRALEAQGFRVQCPDDREQAEIDAAIRQVKVNRASEGRPIFEGVAQAMLDRGCGVLVLACTELPLLLPGGTMAGHCIDTNETLARAIVKQAFAGASHQR